MVEWEAWIARNVFAVQSMRRLKLSASLRFVALLFELKSSVRIRQQLHAKENFLPRFTDSRSSQTVVSATQEIIIK